MLLPICTKMNKVVRIFTHQRCKPDRNEFFWPFMYQYHSFVLRKPELSMLVYTFNKMTTTKQRAHLNKPQYFFNSFNPHG
jgi:deoxyribodipyrimidine photolyase-like uncharacterized protein